MKIAIIHPYLKEPIIESDRESINLNELNNFADSSCDSIYLTDALDFVPINDRSNALDLVVSKLRYGGSLVVRGLDLTDVSRMIYLKELDINSAMSILYNNRQSAESLPTIKERLKLMGLHVISCYQENLYYQIEVKRPDVK